MHERVQGSIVGLVQYEKVRFILVGIANTAIDFGILFALVNLAKFSPMIANIISTSIALIVSYGLNKRSVFGDNDKHNPKQIVLFVVVTLSGLWILQSAIIFVVSGWLHTLVTKNAALLFAKIIATLFSLTWNYLWYSRVIFKGKSA